MTTLPPDVPLQAALDALEPGAVLQLAPATYRLDAPLRLHRGVRLVGAGAGRTRLLRARTPHAHVAAALVPGCEELVLEGLTLGWDDASGTYLFESDVLVVAGGRVRMAGCRLAGSEAEHARSNDMYGGAGLRAYGNAVVRAEGSEIVGHGGHGVLAGERADVALANGWIAGNRGMGTLALGEAVVEARATAFTENGRGGVGAFDDARVTLVEATIQDNRRFGVRLGGRRAGRLTGCVVEGNAGPGVAVDAGGASIVGGQVRRNAGDGVVAAAGVHVALAEVEIAENRGFGVAGEADLDRVSVHGNGRGGMG